MARPQLLSQCWLLAFKIRVAFPFSFKVERACGIYANVLGASFSLLDLYADYKVFLFLSHCPNVRR